MSPIQQIFFASFLSYVVALQSDVGSFTSEDSGPLLRRDAIHSTLSLTEQAGVAGPNEIDGPLDRRPPCPRPHSLDALSDGMLRHIMSFLLPRTKQHVYPFLNPTRRRGTLFRNQLFRKTSFPMVPAPSRRFLAPMCTAFVDLLGDRETDFTVRSMFLRPLTQVAEKGDEKVIAAVVLIFEDERRRSHERLSMRVRANAVRALALLVGGGGKVGGNEKAIAAIVERLAEADKVVQAEAISALVQIARRGNAEEVIAEILKQLPMLSRDAELALHVLGRIVEKGDAKVFRAVSDFLIHEGSEVRFTALRVLGAFAEQKGDPGEVMIKGHTQIASVIADLFLAPVTDAEGAFTMVRALFFVDTCLSEFCAPLVAEEDKKIFRKISDRLRDWHIWPDGPHLPLAPPFRPRPRPRLSISCERTPLKTGFTPDWEDDIDRFSGIALVLDSLLQAIEERPSQGLTAIARAMLERLLLPPEPLQQIPPEPLVPRAASKLFSPMERRLAEAEQRHKERLRCENESGCSSWVRRRAARVWMRLCRQPARYFTDIVLESNRRWMNGTEAVHDLHQ